MESDIASSSLPSTDVYVSLDLTQSSIRLLQVLPRRSKGLIQCTLENVPRDKIKYVCLSYTWGEPTPTHTIVVNGLPLTIRHNLYDFLCLVRKLKLKHWLWIDALCINQQNVYERNHQVYAAEPLSYLTLKADATIWTQVQQMSEIYRGAEHVLVYPGPLPRRLKFVSLLSCPFNRPRWLPLWLPTKWNQVFQRIFASTKRDIENLAYWTRIWIVQELLVARNCVLVSKSGLIQWRSFRPLYEEHYEGVPQQLFQPLLQLFCDPKVGATGYHSRRVEFNKLVRNFDIFNSGSKMACSDRRDFVYGLLGLVEGAQDFAVDYQRTTVSLFLDAVHHFQLLVRDYAFMTLAEQLRLRTEAYCLSCVERIANRTVPLPPRFAESNFVFLVVYDKTTQIVPEPHCDACEPRALFNRITARLPRGMERAYRFVRLAEDKMFCYGYIKKVTAPCDAISEDESD